MAIGSIPASWPSSEGESVSGPMSDEQLATAARELGAGAKAARAWVAEVRHNAISVANEAVGLVGDARRAENLARKLGAAAGRRNCVGVFGPSQAGKSYLVSALARRPGGVLEASFAGQRKNFLTDINPPGDRESTGLVTRFTADRASGDLDPSFPVELRLLSETDLVKIFANSFYSDFDPNNSILRPPGEDDVRKAIEEAEKRAGGTLAAHLDEVTLFDLGEYFQRNFGARIEGLDRAGYWEALIALAGRLPIEDRAALFSQLWGRIPAFTDLFIKLAQWLDRLGQAGSARAALNALVPRDNSIIDVTILSRLGQPADNADKVVVKPVGKSGAVIELPRGTLAALVAEIKIVMTDSPWGFFDHTDLLDFPGARSRLKLIGLPSAPDEQMQQLRELFLRGKIAYLFQRYAEERELTAMLLCMPPSVAEVKDLAPMVKGWIEQTHGVTPAERARVKNALFLVLTKFDLEFIEKGGETADSRRGKWDRRLHASLLELYGKDGWTEDWDGKPFANTLFLRNPGMKQTHIMAYRSDRGADGIERPVEPLVETGVAPAADGLLAEYRAAFTESALCAKHFADRAAVWSAAFAPNDGGVSFLVDRLEAVLDRGLKQRQIAERLGQQAKRLSDAFGRFFHAGAEQGRREAEARLADLRKGLARGLAPLNAQSRQPEPPRKFTALLDRALLTEGEARGLFLNVGAMKLGAATAAETEDYDPLAPPAPTATSAASATDRAAVFAGEVMAHWTARLRHLSRDEGLRNNLRLDAKTLDALAQELIVGAQRLGLAAAIADGVRAETRAATVRWPDVAGRIAGRTAMLIGDYVAGLGFAGRSEAERPMVDSPTRHAIFSLPPLSKGLPALSPAGRAATEQTAFVDWLAGLSQLGMANLAFDGGRDITEAQNRALGDILQRIAIGAALDAAGA